MAKMFSKGFKPKSNTKKAKRIIRSEIKSYDWNAKKLQSQIKDFKKHDRDVFNGYSGGKKLVQGGSFACYYHQTDDMLGKIYGKNNVKKWSNDKKWDTYTHLMSREIDDIYRTGKINIASKNKNKSKKSR